MIDMQSVRVSALNNRVPGAVLGLELIGAAVALGLLALYISILGRGLVPISCSQQASSRCSYSSPSTSTGRRAA